MNPDGSGMRVVRGRHSQPGPAWIGTADPRALDVVNERNTSAMIWRPIYFTSVRDGAYYGWPYAYSALHENPTQKVKRPELVAKSVGAGLCVRRASRSAGTALLRGSAFPGAYRGGAFITQHGSMHSSKLAGYDVVFISFSQTANRAEKRSSFSPASSRTRRSRKCTSRPVGLAMLGDGSVLVADDAGNRIWRVTYGPQNSRRVATTAVNRAARRHASDHHAPFVSTETALDSNRNANCT